MSESTNRSPSSDRHTIGPLWLAGSLGLIATWVAIMLGVGWAIGILADKANLPGKAPIAFAGIALCMAVLYGMAWLGYRAYEEVRGGLDEALSDSPTRRRPGNRYIAFAVAPVIGLLIGLMSSGVHGHGPGASSSVSAPAPAHAAAAPTGSATAPVTAGTTYTVRAGDKLTTIAEHFYGAAAGWVAIASANAGKLHEPTGSRLVDPSLLPAGLVLEIPGASGSASVTGTPHETQCLGGAADGTRCDLDRPDSPTLGTSSAPKRDLAIFGALGGFGLVGAAMFARRQRRQRQYKSMRSPVGSRLDPPDPGDANVDAEIRSLSVAELPDWIDAANRLLCAGLIADRATVAPKVSIMRAGPLGIELLLEETNVAAPAGFLVLDGGRTWRLDPRLELADLRERTENVQPFLAGLIPIAEDDTGSYLVACGPGESLSIRGNPDEIRRGLGAVHAHLSSAPWGEIAFFLVGEAHFAGAERLYAVTPEQVGGLDDALQRDPLWRVGLPEAQPIVLVEDAALAEEVRNLSSAVISIIGPMPEADRILYFADGRVTIEPLGLDLPALLPSEAELEMVTRLRTAAEEVPSAHREEEAPLPSPSAELPTSGPIEVRILREVPDLAGAASEAAQGADVVQVLAYLVLHNRRATTAKLRDVLGVYRPDKSQSDKSVFNATIKARSAVGADYLPLARGTQPYTVSPQVTCDWLRFKELVAIARALELAGDPKQAVNTLTIALELIGDGYPCSHDSIVGRYVWLDAEQFLVEIEATVVDAAHSMAMMSIEHRPYEKSYDDAAWAIEQGRRVGPDAQALREAAMFLADARDDVAGISAEFHAAVDAVDSLEIGADVDPRVETLFQALSRAPRGSAPPSQASVGE